VFSRLGRIGCQELGWPTGITNDPMRWSLPLFLGHEIPLQSFIDFNIAIANATRKWDFLTPPLTGRYLVLPARVERGRPARGGMVQ
jgi:hypothetical protein